jgi:hypothetical protein
MAEIHQHSAVIHRRDYLSAKGRESLIVDAEASVSDSVGDVVGELHHTHAKVSESMNRGCISAQHFRVLKGEHYAKLAFGLATLYVSRATNKEQVFGVGLDEGQPCAKILHRRLYRILWPHDMPCGYTGDRNTCCSRIRKRSLIDSASGAGRNA